MCKNVEVNFDTMTDEEIDRFYAERKVNSDKSMLSLFVYKILEEYTDSSHHLSQREIREKLAEYPYSLEIERKALGRTIHSIAACDLGVYTDPYYGTWMERKDA